MILFLPFFRPELGKSLNTDEAIALGAVYQGAGHTKLFRVKKFIVKEGAVYPIQVSKLVSNMHLLKWLMHLTC